MSVNPEQQPFRRPRRTRPGRVVVAIVLAALLHGLFLLLLIAAQHLQLVLPPEPLPPKKEAVSLRTLTPQQWAQNRGEPTNARPNAQTPLEERKPPPPEEKPKGQVVDVAPGNDQKPNDSKYLAEHNNTVKKETKSRDRTSDYRNAMPHRTTTAPVQSKPQEMAEAPHPSGNGGTGQDDKPKQQAEAKKSGGLLVPDIQPRDQIAMRTPKDGEGPGLRIPNQPESDQLHGNSNRFQLDQPGQRGAQAGQDGSEGRAGNPAIANLVPNQSTLDKIDGAPSNDHLEGVDEGDETFLNTQEWKYAGFFNRVKQTVGTQWDPGQVMHRRDPTGNVYGTRDRYTLLAVTLTSDGSLKDVHVERSSGLDFLDQEAIHAFERAQPFPNPPPGLLASDQLVHFQFGFFLDLSGVHGLRLFRSGP